MRLIKKRQNKKRRKEAALKEKELTLKNKEACLNEKEVTLKIKEAYLNEKEDYLNEKEDYLSVSYYKITGLSFDDVLNDKGRFGEYLIYKNLQHYESAGAKFLFNIYIPTEKGRITEIDVLMICSKGVFVFESKNYSGWIFGDEKSKQWCQTLSNNYNDVKKEFFYNPILQNKNHIKHLGSLVQKNIPYWSFIVFSDRCSLMELKNLGNDVQVLHREDLSLSIQDLIGRLPEIELSDELQKEIYDILYPFTQIDEETKARHVENILMMGKEPLHIEETEACRTENIHIEKIEPACLEEKEKAHSEKAEPADSEDNEVDFIVNNIVDSLEDKEAVQAPVSIEAENEEGNACLIEKNGEEIEQTAGPHELICPECGGNLVLKKAGKGYYNGNRFYGCSNYPKCKYIRNCF